MPQGRTAIIREAHRRISVLSVDEEISGDMADYAFSQLEALFDELLVPPHSMPFTFDLGETPDALYRPLAWLLAVQLAPHYLVPAPETEARAMARVRAYAFVDDRDDRRDLDEDGTVTEAEENADLRAQFY